MAFYGDRLPPVLHLGVVSNIYVCACASRSRSSSGLAAGGCALGVLVLSALKREQVSATRA